MAQGKVPDPGLTVGEQFAAIVTGWLVADPWAEIKVKMFPMLWLAIARTRWPNSTYFQVELFVICTVLPHAIQSKGFPRLASADRGGMDKDFCPSRR